MLSLPGDLGWSHKFVANFSADLNIGYGVKYRISYGADLSFWGSDGYTPLYYLSGNNKATITNAHQSSNRGTVWQLENVLTWDKTFNKHTINLVAGQSAMQNTGMNLKGALQNLKDINKPFMNNTSADQSRGEMSASGGPAYEHTLSSYFFRASYNYDSATWHSLLYVATVAHASVPTTATPPSLPSLWDGTSSTSLTSMLLTG